jgi:hypothetical protein
VPDRKKVGFKRSWLISQVCSCAQCAMQKKLFYFGALPSLAHVESCGAKTCPAPPRVFIPPPPSQATGNSDYLQLWRGMDLDSAHLVDSRAAQSRTCGYRIVYVDIVLYFSSSNTVSWKTLQMIYLSSIDCCYLVGWSTTAWNKNFWVPSSHFSWAVLRTLLLSIIPYSISYVRSTTFLLLILLGKEHKR